MPGVIKALRINSIQPNQYKRIKQESIHPWHKWCVYLKVAEGKFTR